MQVDSDTVPSPALSSHAIDQFSAMETTLEHQLCLGDDSVVEKLGKQGNAERFLQTEDKDEEENEEENEEGEGEGKGSDCEFSFVCEEAISPISADDLFDNGQIRPIFPWIGNDAVPEPLNVDEEVVRLVNIPAEKVLIKRNDLPSTSSYSELEDIDRVAKGTYCVWSKRTASAGESSSKAPQPQACQKSNSTGFSKLWKFRQLLHRSQSDGKETLVFLTTENGAEKDKTTSSSSKKNKKNSSSENGKKGGTAAKINTTSPSPSYTALTYRKNGEKRREKRRSYLPYRQGLLGFFTNANAVSRNVHPY